jgi:hypothetical protein
LLSFHFGMRCGVGFIGFGVEVGFRLVVFVLVVFVEFVLFDVDYGVFYFDHFFRFAMVVNILVERAQATEGRNVILFGAESGCFALGFGDVFGESGGFFFRELMMCGIEVIGDRFGFRFGFKVGDFRLGVIASGESFVGFVAGTGIRFGPLGG